MAKRGTEVDVPNQPWLEHAMVMAIEPGGDALRLARHIALDRRAVYVAAYAYGRLQAWYSALHHNAPTVLHEAAEAGRLAGAAAYAAPRYTQAA